MWRMRGLPLPLARPVRTWHNNDELGGLRLMTSKIKSTKHIKRSASNYAGEDSQVKSAAHWFWLWGRYEASSADLCETAGREQRRLALLPLASVKGGNQDCERFSRIKMHEQIIFNPSIMGIMNCRFLSCTGGLIQVSIFKPGRWREWCPGQRLSF